MSNLFSHDKTLKLIECRLDDVLAAHDKSLLMEAMRYSSLNGGKRIRPLLVMAAGKISAANFDNLLSIGVAIELIHCYSLIHDDLPAMDNDDLRRGIPTCHKKYNEAIAILAGDALQTEAFAILSNKALVLPSDIKLNILNLVATCAGADGMVGGQAIDLLSTNTLLSLAQLQQMHLKKTGALIRASILSGYLAGDQFKQEIYSELLLVAENIGLLFQIVDDILDITADTATLGKTAKKDLVSNKATYVSLLGVSAAKTMALDLYNKTLIVLDKLPQSQELIELTHYVFSRSN